MGVAVVAVLHMDLMANDGSSGGGAGLSEPRPRASGRCCRPSGH